MIYQAGDIGVSVDSGRNTPGATLYRKTPEGWIPFEIDGELVCWPVDIQKLPPGRYEVRES